jgi:hypothetical protein
VWFAKIHGINNDKDKILVRPAGADELKNSPDA